MPEINRLSIAQKCNDSFADTAPDMLIRPCLKRQAANLESQNITCLGKLKKILPNADNEFLNNLQQQMNAANFSQDDVILFLGQVIIESAGFTKNQEGNYDYDPYPKAYLDRKFITDNSKVYRRNVATIIKNNKELEKINKKLGKGRVTGGGLVKLQDEKATLLTKNQELNTTNCKLACKMKKAKDKLISSDHLRKYPSYYDDRVSDLVKEIEGMPTNQAKKWKQVDDMARRMAGSTAESEMYEKALKHIDDLGINNMPPSDCGDLSPSDYYGRGGIQITGEEQYAKFFERYNIANGTNLDYRKKADVESVSSPLQSLAASIDYFHNNVKDKYLLTKSDRKRLKELLIVPSRSGSQNEEILKLKILNASYLVNTGTNKVEPYHLKERQEQTVKIKKIVEDSGICSLCDCMESNPFPNVVPSLM